MFYQMFVSTMSFLASIFGYNGALIVKDILSDVSWDIFGMLSVVYIAAHAVLEVEIREDTPKEIAIQKEEYGNSKRMKANPKTQGEVIEVFLGYIFLKFSPTRYIHFKTLKPVRIILGALMGFFFLVGALVSMWHYLPDGVPQMIPDGGKWKHIFHIFHIF